MAINAYDYAPWLSTVTVIIPYVRTYATQPGSNRLSSIAGSDPRNYAYDANGSVTGDGAGFSASYDARGRMASAASAGASAQYRYDPLGRRVRKSGVDHAAYHYDQGSRSYAFIMNHHPHHPHHPRQAPQNPAVQPETHRTLQPAGAWS